jgi:DNA-directed RNA polymerase specialized sigma24 family protein
MEEGVMAKQIVRQAPYLRRYARALTGAQSAGDALVQAAMEGILAGSLSLDPSLPLRTALYRALNQVWRDGEARTADDRDRSPPDYRLQVLSPAQRAVLLLTSMEGFTSAETAQVLDLDPIELERHLAAAEEALERQLATDVLIIEDEPIIGLDLMRLARELGHRVTGVAATRDEAVEMAKRYSPCRWFKRAGCGDRYLEKL